MSDRKRFPAPIRSLGPAHRERMVQHLLALDEHDRYLRFGYPAAETQIRQYVHQIDFGRDQVFGIFNRKLELLAMAHLAQAHPMPQHDGPPLQGAEFGVSVQARARGRGWGQRLFDRALMHARNEGMQVLYIHALSSNAPMLSIAAKAGARMMRDGSETEAFLRLPPADFDSLVSELMQEQFAQMDYHHKAQLLNFGDWLAQLQTQSTATL
jgi:RimJ/RimL family protein N-acetyltransferase